MGGVLFGGLSIATVVMGDFGVSTGVAFAFFYFLAVQFIFWFAGR